MNRSQFQSLVKEEERSAIENVKEEGKTVDGQGRVKADDNVLIKLPKKFCKEITKTLKNGEIVKFYEMHMPGKGMEIDGENISGSVFYPFTYKADIDNENIMCAGYKKDWNIYMKLENGEVLKTTPEKVKEAMQTLEKASSRGMDISTDFSLGKEKIKNKDLNKERSKGIEL